MRWRYWSWFFRGLNDNSGIKSFYDGWLIFHIAIAIFFSYWINSSLKDDAITVTLPLSGIFIGLSFAWAGNFQEVLNSNEIYDMIEKHPDGIENYIYKYQTSILVTLITLVFWALYGIGTFSQGNCSPG